MFGAERSGRPRGWRVVMVAGAVLTLVGTGTAGASARPDGPASGARALPAVRFTGSPGRQTAPAVKPGHASVTRVGSWPPGARASCRYVAIIGARGSGEPSGGKFHGLGAPVNKMISVVQGYLKNRGYSYATYAVNYPADSVSVLQPSPDQIAAFAASAIFPPAAIVALKAYYDHQVKRYLASIGAGVSAVVSKVRSLNRTCTSMQLVFAGYSQGAMVVHQALLKLSGSVTGCVKGTLLLADGNRAKYTRAMEFGTSLHKGEGIETYIRQTADVGPSVGGIASFAVNNAANICNKSDFVCDFNFFTAADPSRGFRVHTSYAVEKNGKYKYEKVLTTAADAVGTGLIYLLEHHSNTCS